MGLRKNNFTKKNAFYFLILITFIIISGEDSNSDVIKKDKHNPKILPDLIIKKKIDAMIIKATPLIEEITGRKYKSKVKYNFISREAYRKILLTEYMGNIQKNISATEVDRIKVDNRLAARKLSKFHIGKYSKKEQIINIIPENINDVKKIYKIADKDMDDFLFIIIAHEMVSAIDNQYFDILGLLSERKTLEERSALTAVGKGSTAYVTKLISDRFKIPETILKKVFRLDMCMLDNPELFDREIFNINYIKGKEFIKNMIKEKGVAGYDMVYKSPPVSTRQIYFPEEYFYPNNISPLDSSRLLKKILSKLPLKGMKSSINNAGVFALRYILLKKNSIDKNDAISISNNLLNSASYYSEEKHPIRRIVSVSIYNFRNHEAAKKYDILMLTLNKKQERVYQNNKKWEFHTIEEKELNHKGFDFVRFIHENKTIKGSTINSIEVTGIKNGLRVNIFYENIEDANEKDFINILDLINREISKINMNS